MGEIKILVGKPSGWVASADVQEDGSVIAIINDNNGIERDRGRYFSSIYELQAYLNSK